MLYKRVNFSEQNMLYFGLLENMINRVFHSKNLHNDMHVFFSFFSSKTLNLKSQSFKKKKLETGSLGPELHFELLKRC
jgi:hypothetical protein